MKKTLILAAVALLSMGAWADETTNPILTAMPSMSITPDARGGGMGDLGTATTPDMNNNYWNVAKWAFMDQKGGISANYTPWLRKIVSDINLAHLEGWYNISDKAGAVSASFSYFKMGEVAIYDGTWDPSGGMSEGQSSGTAYPNEWALDLGYSRKLHDYVSMGVALRFMYSDLNNGYSSSTSGSSVDYKAGWTMAADLGLYYSQPIDISVLHSTQTSYFRLGFTLKNLGGKVTYDQVHSNFIPTSMNLGLSYELPFDKYNKLTFNFEAHKYMVPTKKSNTATYQTVTDNARTTYWDATTEQIKDEYKGTAAAYELNEDAFSDISAVQGIFLSFHDAPGGAAEEFKEINFGCGLEYTYNRQFFGRLGYSHEDRTKGNRRLFEIGAGFHLSIVNFDVAYTVAAASNPLDQTMRFTLGFDVAGIKDLVDNRRNR